MSFIVATAYMEEANQFDWLVAMDAGEVLATGRPAELLARTQAKALDEAFLALIPEGRRAIQHTIDLPILLNKVDDKQGRNSFGIKATDLTMRYDVVQVPNGMVKDNGLISLSFDPDSLPCDRP